ncbi:MAG: methylase [Myxococcaceae bacterium]
MHLRGRTQAGRLRALDAYVVRSDRALLERPEGLFVDVGLGESPVTTIEAAETFRRVNPSLRVRGLDVDFARVERARAVFEAGEAGIEFEVGGFEAIPAGAVVVRAMNVLRGYPVERVSEAHASMGAALIEGGLGIDGTSDPGGDVLTAHLLRRRGERVVREALLFHSSFELGFGPMQFRDWLPRDLRRRVRSGEWIGELFERWSAAWQRVRVASPRESFERSVRAWAEVDPAVDVSWAAEGYVVWRPSGGVPE